MNTDPTHSPSAVARRTALAGLGATGLGVALTAARPAAAQEATPSPLAGNPLVGAWIVDRNPDDPTEIPTTNVLTADGGLIDPTRTAGGRGEPAGLAPGVDAGAPRGRHPDAVTLDATDRGVGLWNPTSHCAAGPTTSRCRQ